MDTKFLSLRHAVELGSRFDDWQVCWLGGWDKHRLFYLVMLAKVAFKKPFTKRPVPNHSHGKKRGVNTKRRR
jgi:hypothetical protein